MPAKKTTTTTPKPAEVTPAPFVLERVADIPKSTRKSSKMAQLVEMLTDAEHLGGTYKLPPRTTANGVRKALLAAGYDCKVAVRSENGQRAHYCKVIGKSDVTETVDKQEAKS